jgi:hypothetical protein
MNGAKSCWQNRVCFSTRKSCQLFNQDTGSNRDPVCVFLISRKIQDRVGGGGGGGGEGGGAEKSC